MTVYNNLPKQPPGFPAAVALGMFDGLHRGHLAVLEALVKESALSGLTPCVFTFSTNRLRPVKKEEGRLLSQSMRDRILKDLGIACVFQPEFSDYKDFSPERFVREVLTQGLNAKFVCCGADFRFGKNAAAGADNLKELLPAGISAGIIPVMRDHGGAISTTRIRALLRDGDIGTANKLLGRPFAIDFKVVHGNKLGRTLEYPTINQIFFHDFTVPRFGVYATVTTVNGKRFSSVTNVGVKPTVGSNRTLSETYIQGFSGDLYGQCVLVEFIGFIRGERRFSGIAELHRQIQADVLTAAEILRNQSDPL